MCDRWRELSAEWCSWSSETILKPLSICDSLHCGILVESVELSVPTQIKVEMDLTSKQTYRMQVIKATSATCLPHSCIGFVTNPIALTYC